MMYMTFATIFIAQAYGIDLSLGQEITMLLVLMITSKGMAGVPRASLVVIAATMSMFSIPEAGLLLILAVDHFLDMGRSATNVVGNAVAVERRRALGRRRSIRRARRHRAAARALPRRAAESRSTITSNAGSAERPVDARRRLGEEFRARLASCGSNPRAGRRTCPECRCPARRRSTCRARAASSRRGPD